MLLSDVRDGPGPVDPFKTEHSRLDKKTHVIEKVTHITHFSPKGEEAEHEGPGIKNSHNYRWTTVEN